jgi:hypothetical protein
VVALAEKKYGNCESSVPAIGLFDLAVVSRATKQGFEELRYQAGAW